MKVTEPEHIFKNLSSLETERLRLRKLMLRDANDIFEYAGNPEVSRFVTWDVHRAVADSISFIRASLTQYDENNCGPWGIVFKENNKLIGTISFMGWNHLQNNAEIGYAMSSDYWNKGIMTEAMKVSLTFGFNKMNLHRIQARCLTDNFASEKVMQKCGMKFEGILREAIIKDGNYHDLKVYSILRNEFKENILIENSD